MTSIRETYYKTHFNPAIQRYILRLERELGRKCRTVWTFTNPLGETFLFGSFCKNHDRLIVTIGNYNMNVSGGFLPAG